MSLREAWERNADDWIRWARSREADHHFWGFNLPRLLDILPPPGRLTVDVGAGEGRVARELHARGHRVVAVEPSAALAAAAREAEPRIEVIEAPAESMPLEDGAADLAVASMSLMNLDDLSAAIQEITRVLPPGGCLCFSIPHPFATGGGDYLAEHTVIDVRERAGLRMEFHDRHRPLGTYFAALSSAGLAVEDLHESLDPASLHLRAAKPGTVPVRD